VRLKRLVASTYVRRESLAFPRLEPLLNPGPHFWVAVHRHARDVHTDPGFGL
jgi:hypothetical protein